MIYTQYKNGQVFNSDIKDLIPYLLEKNVQVDCVITDPPYKIIGGGRNSNLCTGGLFDRNNNYVKSGKLFKYNNIKFQEWVKLIYDILKPNSHCYIYSNDKNLREMQIECHEIGFKLHNIITWVKNNQTPNLYYMKKTEFILFFRKGKAKRINNLGDNNCFFDKIVKNRLHPTQKPIEQIERMILNSSNENDIIFDPFGGSGSTTIAAINTNRKFIINDIDQNYYNISNERINTNLIDKEKL